jgi:hypothetical protein
MGVVMVKSRGCNSFVFGSSICRPPTQCGLFFALFMFCRMKIEAS